MRREGEGVRERLGSRVVVAWCKTVDYLFTFFVAVKPTPGTVISRNRIVRDTASCHPMISRPDDLIRAPCPGSFARFFCAIFFRERRGASPITCLFSDCIHLAAADVRRMSQTKISGRVKVWRMIKGRASHADPASLPFELRFSGLLSLSLLIPADLPSCERNGQDGIMSATSQGPAKVERWAPEWAAEPPASLERCWSLHWRDCERH